MEKYWRKMDPQLQAFAEHAYQDFDVSHNLDHVLTVAKNAQKIFTSDEAFFREAQLHTAILHDALDDKYVMEQRVTKNDIAEFLCNRFPEEWVQRILFTIENSSWSKRKQVKYNSPHYHCLLFHSVRDADWLESIDIPRCLAYGRKIKSPEPIKRCIYQVEERMMHIADALYFAEAREMAKPRHQYIMEWYYDHR